jgi:hypothetical protein
MRLMRFMIFPGLGSKEFRIMDSCNYILGGGYQSMVRTIDVRSHLAQS